MNEPTSIDMKAMYATTDDSCTGHSRSKLYVSLNWLNLAIALLYEFQVDFVNEAFSNLTVSLAKDATENLESPSLVDPLTVRSS